MGRRESAKRWCGDVPLGRGASPSSVDATGAAGAAGASGALSPSASARIWRRWAFAVRAKALFPRARTPPKCALAEIGVVATFPAEEPRRVMPAKAWVMATAAMISLTL